MMLVLIFEQAAIMLGSVYNRRSMPRACHICKRVSQLRLLLLLLGKSRLVSTPRSVRLRIIGTTG